MSEIWRVPIPAIAFDWRDGFRAIADAPALADLSVGVVDPLRMVRRTVNVPLTTAWRVNEYEQFAQDMIASVDHFWPGYAAARASGRVLHMPQAQAAIFDQATSHPELLQHTILATLARVTLHLGLSEVPTPATPIRSSANQALMPYARVYQKYFVKLASRFAPQPNDWGDLECFIYAQGPRQVFTFENRWREIATDAGQAALLYLPRW